MTVDQDNQTRYTMKGCAFCKGEGFIGSVTCPACNGHCEVAVAVPATPCSCCAGFGVAGCCRCSVCNGTGWSGVNQENKPS